MLLNMECLEMRLDFKKHKTKFSYDHKSRPFIHIHTHIHARTHYCANSFPVAMTDCYGLHDILGHGPDQLSVLWCRSVHRH